MHRLHTPAPPLDAFVRCFWYWEGAPQLHAHERLMPNGEAAIIFNLRDEEMRTYDPENLDRYVCCGLVTFSGPRMDCFAIETTSEDRVVGIQFQPGGTFPFFRAPASEMANQSLPLECLWRAATGEIREQLLAAGSVDAMFAVLEHSLMVQLARPLGLHPAVGYARAHICRAPHIATVSGLARATEHLNHVPIV